MLQGLEPEVGQLGDILARCPDAEDAAGVLGRSVIAEEFVREPAVTARHGMSLCRVRDYFAGGAARVKSTSKRFGLLPVAMSVSRWVLNLATPLSPAWP